MCFLGHSPFFIKTKKQITRQVMDRAEPFKRNRAIWVTLFLLAAILFSYWQVGSHEFINLDTYSYVVENPHVNSGLSIDNIVWAFTTTHYSTWYPISWLSHMLDVQLFGMNAGAHHLVNLLFHIVNTLLLFYFLQRATGTFWRGAVVAALFAIHPLHVESVAWVAERKGLLSTCMLLLTCIAYQRYVSQPSIRRFLPVLLFYGLGLMAKAMLVTLPCLLLLLDYWPFDRLKKKENLLGTAAKIIAEKIPLLLLATLSSATILFAHQEWDSLVTNENASLLFRLSNGLVSYVTYLAQTIWPSSLTVLYPLTEPESWLVTISLLLLSLFCFLVVRFCKSRPWLIVGWLWFLGSLVPVLGLVQVGTTVRADRFTYIPLLGIYIIFSWLAAESAAALPRLKKAIIVAVCTALAALTVTTRNQTGLWQNNITIYEHTLANTTDNYVIHYNMGLALSEKNRLVEADQHFAAAADINPQAALLYIGWGINSEKRGEMLRAAQQYKLALQLDEEQYYSHELHTSLGIIKAKRGNFLEAADHFRKSLKIKPHYNEDAAYNLGNLHLELENYKAAVYYFTKAISDAPDYAGAHFGLGNAKLHQNRPDEAISHFTTALSLAPDNIIFRRQLEMARRLTKLGKKISR